ncbi:MAG: DNA repair protein RadA [Acidimicrobiia bacterium]
MSYACGECGYTSPKWMGFCPRCRAEGALTEVADAGRSRPTGPPPATTLVREAGDASTPRRSSGIGEVDRVLGGGFVAGAAVLVGGEPGVGKSSLLLQVAGHLGADGATVLVATAEESAEQVGLRARRLGVGEGDVRLLAHDDVDAILGAADELEPDLLVVDSIQTVRVGEVGSAAGSVGQVREAAARIIRHAKDTATPTVIVGHVTKDGGIAGPRMLEHMVDVVLYLQGEADRGLRVLSGLKNRFGTTNVSGLFEMGHEGLTEIADPSSVFVGGRRADAPGSVVFPTLAGRRTMLVEVQALVGSSSGGPNPRRSVRGVESSRVHQILAVLQRHAGLSFWDREVYVAVSGGVQVREPEADLPVAVALASSLLDRPVGDVATWGEVGLTGEVRVGSQAARRAEEAARLGLRSVAPPVPTPVQKALADLGLLSG